MRILFVSSYFGYKSGFNKAASDILYSLLKTEHNICVVTKSTYVPLPIKTKRKYKLIRVPWKIKRPPLDSSFNLRSFLKWSIRSIEDIFRIGFHKKVKSFLPDLIIVNSYSYKLIQGIDFKSVPNVFINHGGISSSELAVNSDHNVTNTIKLMSQFSYLIFVSDNVRKDWLSFDQLKNKPSFYIPNCTNETTSAHVLKKNSIKLKFKLGFDRNKFNVICVANVHPRKGQDLIIKSFINYYDNLKDVVFHFVGDFNNEYGHELINYIIKHNLKDNLKFHGVKRNVLEYIFASDLFVLPSRGEAFPLVLLEAMSTKKAILASNVDGIPEIVKNGKTGYTFPINDVDIFWEHFIELYRDEEKRLIFSNNAYNLYFSEFSRKEQIIRYDLALKRIQEDICR